MRLFHSIALLQPDVTWTFCNKSCEIWYCWRARRKVEAAALLPAVNSGSCVCCSSFQLLSSARAITSVAAPGHRINERLVISRLPGLHIARLCSFCLILFLVTYHNVSCFTCFPGVQKMTQYCQPLILQWTESHVLNSWEKLFFPCVVKHNRHNVIYFLVEDWWSFFYL